ncbi:bifunctional [glutamate--ammonia ligase]-adenylyl-L-tyrosine phosphorylase/[glutamate--ammonia-ligase] adenylyltransferase [Litoribrevibacter albus]|uniref:Bifunctional glutamine synthetase adenylyltransferase/adenylyl-removing enzyme n=1 Tax=Litoribrevibacter albus TaxID=1473156 RepID=A0AA37SAU7_9GAMM|nr:bifunctional [glutamate--ammonia ligase]-adenylyl-L-tyrosine phosphorylase/[glutamate--ammonia-ligase] adenylyltransferase [Litoribrevibacter albus]GLQ32512.1 glutamate-ammonia-ligase adenylyltransferase [Litoribrevibacter albus]
MSGLHELDRRVNDEVEALSSVELQNHVRQQWQQIKESSSIDAVCQLLQGGDGIAKEFVSCVVGSDYVVDCLLRYPSVLQALIEKQTLRKSLPEDYYSKQIGALVRSVDSEVNLSKQLRLARHEMMIRVIWRDINGLAELFETTRDLSRFADACVEHTMNWHTEALMPIWGEPFSKDYEGNLIPQRMLVLGMGKLGADELNLSSDIDLIFAFPESGWTKNGKREISNQEFFTKVGQKLIQTLDSITAEGFVFRVDMRLRPYGDSGPLVMSFNQLESYYQSQGREWERYAMIKARVMAGGAERAQELVTMLRPFVYRKYIDFSVIEALRGLKDMINREVRRKGMEHNIKLGRGGIREVEFIAQVFQLIHGGMDVRLQNRSLMAVLAQLENSGVLSADAYQNLVKAYHFLRDTEHALQALQDRQTQLLPEDAFAQARVAHVMGFAGWSEFSNALDQHRQNVAAEFVDLIQPADEERQTQESSFCDGWRSVWLDEMDDDEAIAVFEAQCFDDPAAAWKLIRDLKQSKKVRTLQREGQERLNQFIPNLLHQLACSERPTETLSRVLILVESVIRRTAYLVLLMENPVALVQLIKLCDASPWIANQLAKTPVILDELINVSSLYSPPNKQELQDELRQHMLRIPEDDLEALMEALRYFKNAHVLRVAAAEVTGALPLMKASDYLTYIAEVILETVVEISWHQMVERYGYPTDEEGSVSEPQLIVVGYGKLGGIELSYGSDLDIVFIHNANVNKYTDGAKQVDNQTFYTRMVQRIVHIMTTMMPSGDLYEVDMRLRPEGNSGMLVASLKAFEDYQFKNAWTWEHQALVRARVVAGASALAEQFDRVRKEVLANVPKDTLKASVVDMRKKMRASMASAEDGMKEGVFHLKHDAGGIVDIEFMTQYAVLKWGADYPDMLTWSDNIRILETMESLKLMDESEVNLLIDAYKAFRIEGHRKILDNQKVVLEEDELTSYQDYRQKVVKIWQHFMEDDV